MALQITGQAQGLIAPIAQKSGQANAVSMGWNNELLVTELLPRYANLVLTGSVFAVQYGTNSTYMTASTVGAFGLFNPVGSGKNLVLLDSTVVIVSMPAANASTFMLGLVAVPQFPTSPGAGNLPVNQLVGSQLQAVGKTFTSGTLTSASTAASRLVFSFFQDAAATTSIVTPVSYRDQIDGEVIIAPGNGVALFPNTSGSSATTSIIWTPTWAELPA
jgi:hypothetical protein